ncbi:ketopantoate reductase family protein [Pseudogemmobacter sonorensis]|uniref:ketopantoate reductase family protein n=1 Tax=Pseudogemmobacter sonorensis TaxID=2989681 RepID=UPI00369FED57
MAKEPFLIWGVGAIGGTIAAHLARAGHEVAVVDTARDHVEMIRTRGLHVFGPLADFTIRIPAFLPEELMGKFRRILLAVKTPTTDAALAGLLPHLADDGYVASFQNGLCERRIAEVVGPARTMGAFINFGADWHGPGEILFGNRAAVVVGEIDGHMTLRLAELHSALLDFEPEAIQTDRVFAHLWGKLAYLTLLYAQALGDLGIGDCIARPELRGLWGEILGEANRVAHAEGETPIGFDGFDPEAFGVNGTLERQNLSIARMVEFNRASAKTHSGIWRDLAVRKRKTEVAQQIEQIALIGASHGIETPRVRKLVTMIREIENGTRQIDDANLLELAA